MTRQALYPGTFDPLTNGHMDVIHRALKQYDELVIAVSDHQKKAPLFTAKERVGMVEKAVAGLGGVRVISFTNLVADLARAEGATAVIRGLRVTSDFEYEFTMAQYVANQAPEVEMVYLMAGAETLHISSSAVKEIASLGGDVSAYVNVDIQKKLEEKYAV